MGMHNNRMPPDGYDWGERTRQARQNAPRGWRSDAEEMGRRYGITEIDVEAFVEKHPKAICYPDLVIHERNPEVTETEKGTNAIIKGNKKGCGKSTLLRYLARQMMHHNHERFVWRGSASRSEWLPFRKWTTLYLPSSVEMEAVWMREGDNPNEAPMEAIDDLENEVREVVVYDDIFHLLQTIGNRPGGTFNVVYPDPAFRGCREVFDRSQDHSGDAPYTPSWESTEEQPATPISHWWYAFIVARVEHGPFQPWALGFDESGDIMPTRQEVRADEHATHAKVMTTRKALADSRRAFLTWLFVCHYEKQLFDEIRDEADWRIHMPDGSPNPVKGKTSTIPQGFDSVAMLADVMSDAPVGHALCYDQNRWSFFKWKDIPDELGDEERWLKLQPELSGGRQPTHARVRDDDTEGPHPSEVVQDA